MWVPNAAVLIDTKLRSEFQIKRLTMNWSIFSRRVMWNGTVWNTSVTWSLLTTSSLLAWTENIFLDQKQPFRGVLGKRCSENMQKIYRRTPMPKCEFNKPAKQLYWSRTSAWVFSCKFSAYFQNTFLTEHLWRAAPARLLWIVPKVLHFTICTPS